MAYKAASLSHRVPRSYHTAARLRSPVVGREAAPTWYVIVTNPRCEERAKGGLDAIGYETFLPILAKWRRLPKHQGGGRERVELPLFPRYLFVGLDPLRDPFYPIRLTDGVAGLVTNNGAPISVPDRIITPLMKAQERGDHDETIRAAERLASLIGQQVEITSGPFAGLFATVMRATGKTAHLETATATGVPIKLDMPIAELEGV